MTKNLKDAPKQSSHDFFGDLQNEIDSSNQEKILYFQCLSDVGELFTSIQFLGSNIHSIQTRCTDQIAIKFNASGLSQPGWKDVQMDLTNLDQAECEIAQLFKGYANHSVSFRQAASLLYLSQNEIHTLIKLVNLNHNHEDILHIDKKQKTPSLQRPIYVPDQEPSLDHKSGSKRKLCEILPKPSPSQGQPSITYRRGSALTVTVKTNNSEPIVEINGPISPYSELKVAAFYSILYKGSRGVALKGNNLVPVVDGTAKFKLHFRESSLDHNSPFQYKFELREYIGSDYTVIDTCHSEPISVYTQSNQTKPKLDSAVSPLAIQGEETEILLTGKFRDDLTVRVKVDDEIFPVIYLTSTKLVCRGIPTTSGTVQVSMSYVESSCSPKTVNLYIRERAISSLPIQELSSIPALDMIQASMSTSNSSQEQIYEGYDVKTEMPGFQDSPFCADALFAFGDGDTTHQTLGDYYIQDNDASELEEIPSALSATYETPHLPFSNNALASDATQEITSFFCNNEYDSPITPDFSFESEIGLAFNLLPLESSDEADLSSSGTY
eukprot:TRINITY_DN7824_c0_g1_i1.p1 TRINITY_DN7824_c0_g1~~TRINITY_DN7824_c0_g1_i1.p1  ORF type:complete len:632 (+),score=201.17 TRINITY_DN7824_c0_g1_i1:238-1896(+)